MLADGQPFAPTFFLSKAPGSPLFSCRRTAETAPTRHFHSPSAFVLATTVNGLWCADVFFPPSSTLLVLTCPMCQASTARCCPPPCTMRSIVVRFVVHAARGLWRLTCTRDAQTRPLQRPRCPLPASSAPADARAAGDQAKRHMTGGEWSRAGRNGEGSVLERSKCKVYTHTGRPAPTLAQPVVRGRACTCRRMPRRVPMTDGGAEGGG